MMYYILPTNRDLQHHGVDGQKWGQKNGPPYPLNKQGRADLKKQKKAVKKAKILKKANKTKEKQILTQAKAYKKARSSGISTLSRTSEYNKANKLQNIYNKLMNQAKKIDADLTLSGKMLDQDLAIGKIAINNALKKMKKEHQKYYKQFGSQTKTIWTESV